MMSSTRNSLSTSPALSPTRSTPRALEKAAVDLANFVSCCTTVDGHVRYSTPKDGLTTLRMHTTRHGDDGSLTREAISTYDDHFFSSGISDSFTSETPRSQQDLFEI